MVLREIVRGKKRGLGIPEGIIESQTPIMAITRRRFLIPSENLKVAHGVAEGSEAGVWYFVPYPEPILNADVVAVGEAKVGAITSRIIDKVPDIPIPLIDKPLDVSSEIVDLTRLTLTEYINAIFAALPSALEPLPSPYWGNWRNFMAQAGGRILYWLQQALFPIWEGNIESAINTAIADLNSKINVQASNITSAFNAKITEINDKINTQIDTVTDRVNAVLEDLYAMWGLPSHRTMVSAMIRNVSDTGFEWLSLGNMTIHWVAVGEK